MLRIGMHSFVRMFIIWFCSHSVQSAIRFPIQTAHCVCAHSNKSKLDYSKILQTIKLKHDLNMSIIMIKFNKVRFCSYAQQLFEVMKGQYC